MSTATFPYDQLPGHAPTAEAGPRRAADYWQLPEGEPVELIHGRFIMSPSPNTTHQIVLACLMGELLRIAKSNEALVLPAPTDVVLSDHTILQPDILYISKQRRGIVHQHVEGPPDIVVEIASPSTSRRDRLDKRVLYAEYGVAEYWMVDLAGKFIEFLLLEDGRYVVQNVGLDRYQSPRLPEVTIDLAAFWADVEKLLPSDGE
ncbi:MAG: Uma2 family endonuclease [Planctomycetota bacterium]